VAVAVHVRLLGEFEVTSGGASIAPGAWRLRKAKTLVKVLALEPGHRMHRDRVVDTLWPDADPSAARNNLHQVVHAARRAIGSVGVATSDALGWVDDVLVLGPGCNVVTDVEEMRSAVESLNGDADPAALAHALQQSPGELLPDDPYEPWAQPHARLFREWRNQLVMRLVDMKLTDQQPEVGVALLAPVVAAEPLHEPAQRAMMTALAAAGRRSEALLVFERLRTALQEELAADPEPQTRQLFRELLTQSGPIVVPAPRSPDTLPASVTSLIGRDRELAETAAALRRTRALTLTGMGGVGKTTLALELGRRCASDYADGVHLVELGTLTEGAQVVTQLARTLRLELPSQARPVEALVAQLRRRQLLLVVDSCEHLLDACAELVGELLRGCPGVVVLATSREPLRIDGELTWRTPSLSLPDPARTSTVAELSTIASVELFVRRASATAPFALTDDNAGAVVDICYRLDGIPLALELAAACVAFLSPQQIADRLGDSLTLLRRGDRSTVTRQQTLAATIAWSHDLLRPDERVLFRRLATFAGSFTLDAVDDICSRDLSEGAVLTALARLVDTSLVSVDVRGDTARYRLLETVQQFAAGELRESGENDDLRRRHCDWYVRFAEARDPHSATGAVDSTAAAAVELEHDNLRAAHSWSLTYQSTAALRLAVALWRHWLTRGLVADGRRWLEEALAADSAVSGLRARALLALAVFDVRRGDGGRLQQFGAEVVGITRASSHASALARGLHADGVLAYMRGDWDECWQRSSESMEAAPDGDDGAVAAALHLRALVHMGRGQLPQARALLTAVREALAGVRDVRQPFFLPLMLGFAVEGASEPMPRVYFEETVLLGRQVAARQADGYVLCNLGGVARLRGDVDEARGLIEEGVSRFVAIGDRDGEALALNLLGCLHRVAGDVRDARTALNASLRLRRAIGDRRSIGMTQANLGVLTATEGDADAGCEMVEQALAGFEETQDRAGAAGVAMSWASTKVETGGYDSAARDLVMALPDAVRVPANHRAGAWSYLLLGDLHERLGRPSDAARAFAEAARLFAVIRSTEGTAQVKARRELLQIAD
jgi:predicted ATPase/DNA-binding SARP family transcriptional activator